MTKDKIDLVNTQKSLAHYWYLTENILGPNWDPKWALTMGVKEWRTPPCINKNEDESVNSTFPRSYHYLWLILLPPNVELRNKCKSFDLNNIIIVYNLTTQNVYIQIDISWQISNWLILLCEWALWANIVCLLYKI